MDLRLLKTFRTVVETGSVSGAAGVLLVSQPALSRQLQQLERELGIALFLRHQRRLELTAAGRRFLEAATAILTSVEAARSLADSLAAGRVASVRMAAPTTTLSDVLAPFLAELRPKDPLITVEEAAYATAVDRLRTGVDVAILTAPPPPRFASRRVAVLPVWAYVGPTHPWSTRTEISTEELARQPLVVLDPSARPRQLLDEAFVQDGFSPSELIECRNPQVAQALAAAHRGIAVLSDDPRFNLLPLGIRTSRGPLTLTLHAAWDGQHHASTELDGLARRLRDFCLSRYGAVDEGRAGA